MNVLQTHNKICFFFTSHSNPLKMFLEDRILKRNKNNLRFVLIQIIFYFLLF